MKTFLVTNQGGVPSLRELDSTGQEANLSAFARRHGLPERTRTFVQLLEGQEMILRTLANQGKSA